MPRFEFDVRYSEAQIRRSIWAYVRISLRRAMKWHDWVLIVGGTIGLIAFAIADRGRWWWWLAVVVVATTAIVVVAMWRSYIANSLERFARMKNPVANCVADDDNFTVSSDLGSATMPWPALTETIDGPGFLYLKAGKGSLITLPVEGVDAQALQFIRDRVAAASKP